MSRAGYLRLALLAAASCQSRLAIPDAYYCTFVNYGGSPGADFCQGWFTDGGGYDLRTIVDAACTADVGGSFSPACPTSGLLGRCDIAITSGNLAFTTTMFIAGKACQFDTDCGGGIACQNQICTDVACTDGSNCGSGSLCNAGICANFCMADADCGSSFLCAGLTCNADSDCIAGLSCQNGACAMACNASADCIGHVPCLNNACQYGICTPEFWTPVNSANFCGALNNASSDQANDFLTMTATWTQGS